MTKKKGLGLNLTVVNSNIRILSVSEDDFAIKSKIYTYIRFPILFISLFQDGFIFRNLPFFLYKS